MEEKSTKVEKENFVKQNKENDKGLCIVDKLKDSDNLKSISCAAYRKNYDGQLKKMAITEFKIAEPEIILSLYTTNGNTRQECLKYLADNNFLDAYKERKIMDMKGYYAVTKPSTDEEIKKQSIIIDGKEINRNRGLPIKLNKTNLIYFKNKGIKFIVLHAAGDNKLVDVYKKNGMQYFPDSRYLLFEGIYTFNGNDYQSISTTSEQIKYFENLEAIIKDVSKFDSITKVTFKFMEDGDDIDVEPQKLFVGEIEHMISCMSEVDTLPLYYSTDKPDYFPEGELDEIKGGGKKKKINRKKSVGRKKSVSRKKTNYRKRSTSRKKIDNKKK